MRTAKQRGKKKSLASSAAPDFFPDSLPASCGALTPSGCVHAANPQSSPCDPTKARASAPSPALPSGRADKSLRLLSSARRQASVRESLRFSLCTPVAVGSALIAVARARLWSSFMWHFESPLLPHQETKRQEKVSCLFGSCRLFPDSLPASCGALTPSGCVHATNPSPFPATKALASAPSPARPGG